jgi:hypothetical protein
MMDATAAGTPPLDEPSRLPSAAPASLNAGSGEIGIASSAAAPADGTATASDEAAGGTIGIHPRGGGKAGKRARNRSSRADAVGLPASADARSPALPEADRPAAVHLPTAVDVPASGNAIPLPVEIVAPAAMDEGAAKRSWSYVAVGGGRDLRVDFIRGLVMLVLVVNHFELFSLYAYLVWERIGVVTGAEGFVILSGVVVGMVHRRRVERDGWRAAVWKMWDRAATLYRLNVIVTVSIGLLGLVPLWSTAALTTYYDGLADTTTSLYPAAGMPWPSWIADALLLRFGPHQFQVMGLYVVLLAAAPAALWLLFQKRAGILLGLSWILYFASWAHPGHVFGAMFENAFPVLAWQLLFVHGMAAGFHRERIGAWMRRPLARRSLLAACGVLWLGFFLYTMNNPIEPMPAWTRLHFIAPERFYALYNAYFLKDTLGPLRLVNYFAVLVLGFWLLTRAWKPIHRALGWFFIPIGQASLYVFFVHVYLVLVVSNLVTFDAGDVLTNTLVHTAVLATLWLMVRTKFLFRWIPR